MTGKLISLESTNYELLEKTARFLTLQLRSEGYAVEHLSFPQRAHTSAHFVNSLERGQYGEVNPYIAAMFYALDRYEAAATIRGHLAQGSHVICAGYIGTTLASLGAHLSDASTRKGFYLWADSLETGTFGIPRPDTSLVISEEVATLTELTELFPKDYQLVHDPAKVREVLSIIQPQVVAKHRPPEDDTRTTSWFTAFKNGNVEPRPTKGNYTPPKLSSNAKKLYIDGLHELAELRNIAAKKLPGQKELIDSYLMPLGQKVSSNVVGRPQKKMLSTFTALVDQHISGSYGSVTKNQFKLLHVAPRNELAILSNILLQQTTLSIADIESELSTVSMEAKTRMLQAYLAELDRDMADPAPLNGALVTIAATMSYYDLQKLTSELSTIRFTLQVPSPRWGFEVPKQLESISEEVEACFDCSLSLYSQLEAVGALEAAGLVTLIGHNAQCVMSLTGQDVYKLGKQEKNQLTEVLAEQFPIIMNA